MMSQWACEQAARLLQEARETHKPIAELPKEIRPVDTEGGYQIQAALIRRLGVPVIGWKIGSTAVAAQQKVGATEPFYGPLLACTSFPMPARIPGDTCFMYAIQAEFAVTMRFDLPPKCRAYDYEEVVSAVGSVHPALEVADSRFTDWTRVGVACLVADGGKDGAFVLGDSCGRPEALNLAVRSVSLSVNGEPLVQGSGADVMGHPLNALLWFANKRSSQGLGVKAGDIVSTGTCTGSTLVQRGARVVGDFGDLGEVTLTIER